MRSGESFFQLLYLMLISGFAFVAAFTLVAILV